MAEVFINRISKFLPNDPVDNETMESRLGLIDEKVSKVRRLILRNNRINTRYYALDQERNITHNNAQLTKESIVGLCDEGFRAEDIELLSCGTSSPDQLMPSHTAMVHGYLKNGSMEINSASGACCAGMNALRYGYLALKAGEVTNAVCTGSERTSTWMRSEVFEHEVAMQKELEDNALLAFNKEFLRWMLSDGACAFLLESEPKGPCPIRIEWMDGHSFAHELETCMYAGGEKTSDGNLKPWSEFDSTEWATHSLFAMKQDVKVLGANIVRLGVETLKLSLDKHGLTTDDIDYYLPHISSYYFKSSLIDELKSQGVEVPEEKWFMNLDRVGNVGAASIYLMLEELRASGKLKSGDRIMMHVPESARFSYFLAYLTVVQV